MIDKIYVINLSDRIDRFEKIRSLDSRVQRVNAVDTRTNNNALTDYSLSLEPVGLGAQIYFSTSRGAVGAYLSHYKCWKKILESNDEWVMIIEDDINRNDLKKFLQTDYQFTKQHDFYQLGERTNQYEYIPNFNGFECYVINRRAAQIFIESTHDRSHFNNKIDAQPLQPEFRQHNLFKNEKHIDWSVNNVISCAVDKLAGYCAHEDHPEDKRIRIKFICEVSLDPKLSESDIQDKDIEGWWDWSSEQLEDFVYNNKKFKYWKH